MTTETTRTASRQPKYSQFRGVSVGWAERMPSHWSITAIRHMFDVVNGSTPSSTRDEFWDGDVVWATPDDLGKLIGCYIANTERHITHAGFASCGTTIVPKGSIVLSTRAPIGHVAIAARPLCTNQGCRALVPSSHAIDPLYYYYHLLAVRKLLQSLGRGSTFQELSSDSLGAFKVMVPPFDEQVTIGRYLKEQCTAVDAVVDALNQTQAFLDEYRQAFITEVVTKGLDPDVPMKDSGIQWLGEIPAHWRLTSLRRVVSAFVDYRGATPRKAEHGVPLVTARNIVNGCISFEQSQEFILEEEYDAWMRRGLPETGDVLLTTEAPLGQTAQITDPVVALAQRIILLRPNSGVMAKRFLYFYLSSVAGQGELWSRATGSTVLGIKASHLRETAIVVPPLKEQRSIALFLSQKKRAPDQAVTEIQAITDRLQQYRTALITAAVTGQIDVREVV